MEYHCTRREILRRAALAVPAFQVGFAPWSLRRALATSEDRVNRFDKLRLAVKPDRLGDMRSFYQEVLNLPVIADDPRSLTIRAGGTQLSFYADVAGGSPFYHFAFNIPENKLESAIEWMSTRAPLLKRKDGSPVVHFRWLDAHSIYFRDPAANLLEFIAHHALKNARPGDFKVTDILYASEIGLVTDDVPALAAELDTKLNLTNYHTKLGEPVSDTFRPIGDPYGFFIVVKHKRKWLMTDDPAGLFPVGAELHGGARRQLRLENCDCVLSVAD